LPGFPRALHVPSSVRPAVTRLWKRHAKWRARSVSGRSGMPRARRPAPILISGEIANMPAMLRRTSASCRAGERLAKSAVGERDRLPRLLPVMCSAIAVVPTISPRCGWWAGAISSARCPNCAAVPGSVVTNAFAAWSRVLIATSIARFGARGELHWRLRPAERRLRARRRPPGGRALGGPLPAAGADRLACDVVPESQLVVAFDE